MMPSRPDVSLRPMGRIDTESLQIQRIRQYTYIRQINVIRSAPLPSMAPSAFPAPMFTSKATLVVYKKRCFRVGDE